MTPDESAHMQGRFQQMPRLDGLESRILSLCQEVLECAEVSPFDSLPRLGAGMTEAIQLALRVHKRFHVEIEPEEALDASSLVELIGLIKGRLGQEPAEETSLPALSVPRRNDSPAIAGTERLPEPAPQPHAPEAKPVAQSHAALTGLHLLGRGVNRVAAALLLLVAGVGMAGHPLVRHWLRYDPHRQSATQTTVDTSVPQQQAAAVETTPASSVQADVAAPAERPRIVGLEADPPPARQPWLTVNDAVYQEDSPVERSRANRRDSAATAPTPATRCATGTMPPRHLQMLEEKLLSLKHRAAATYAPPQSLLTGTRETETDTASVEMPELEETASALVTTSTVESTAEKTAAPVPANRQSDAEREPRASAPGLVEDNASQRLEMPPPLGEEPEVFGKDAPFVLSRNRSEELADEIPGAAGSAPRRRFENDRPTDDLWALHGRKNNEKPHRNEVDLGGWDRAAKDGGRSGAEEDWGALGADFAEAYLTRAATHYSRGDYAAAVAEANNALRLHPRSTKAFCLRGNARMNLGDLDAAVMDYNAAIEIKPDYIEALCNRGVLKLLRGNVKGSRADLDRAQRLDPQSPDVYNNRGNTRQVEGDLEGAIIDYGRAIRLQPEFAAAWFNRGRAYQAQGRYRRAIDDFTRALACNPGNPKYLAFRARARQATGDTAGAADDFEAAAGYDR